MADISLEARLINLERIADILQYWTDCQKIYCEKEGVPFVKQKLMV